MQAEKERDLEATVKHREVEDGEGAAGRGGGLLNTVSVKVVDLEARGIVRRKDGGDSAVFQDLDDEMKFYKPRFSNDPKVQQDIYDFYNKVQRQSSQLSEVQEETSPMRNFHQM